MKMPKRVYRVNPEFMRYWHYAHTGKDIRSGKSASFAAMYPGGTRTPDPLVAIESD